MTLFVSVSALTKAGNTNAVVKVAALVPIIFISQFISFSLRLLCKESCNGYAVKFPVLSA